MVAKAAATAMTAETASTPTTTAAEEEAASTACLLCHVGSFVCALPVEHVVEIMRPLPIRHLEDVPPFVLGVALVRGAPAPVVDVARLLGVDSTGLIYAEPPAKRSLVELLHIAWLGFVRFVNSLRRE